MGISPMDHLNWIGGTMDIDLVEQFVTLYLETDDLEGLLEEFDITPQETFLLLFKAGMIDETRIEELRTL